MTTRGRSGSMAKVRESRARRDRRVVRTQNDVPEVALRVLIQDGWEAVTPARVAVEAGYSRATIYSHWPERIDLVRAAFARYGEMPHHEPTGNPREDLRGEIASFCRAMVEHKLDRALATLAEKAQTNPDVVAIRDSFVGEGERPMRETLRALATGARAGAALQMLCGMVTHSVLMHGVPPSDEVIDSAVDIVVVGLASSRSRMANGDAP